ncbi:hypothetical protein NDU88_004547 [Pleurodeles waltl]|uniref:Uncharacterized protein n=1 Tax=Pleurodeles waltl TaxID=8319 RepID=A0AAV7WAP0_PLEWA|nr:hypothetical protein NDU88_004547 [Pleurodeles waltl]
MSQRRAAPTATTLAAPGQRASRSSRGRLAPLAQLGPSTRPAAGTPLQHSSRRKHHPAASPSPPTPSQVVWARWEAAQKDKYRVHGPPPAEPHGVATILQDGQATPPFFGCIVGGVVWVTRNAAVFTPLSLTVFRGSLHSGLR